MNHFIRHAAFAIALLSAGPQALAAEPDYFDDAESLSLSRDSRGILTVRMHDDGGPIVFNATDHEQFVDVFYAIARDRDNKIVILTGAAGDWMSSIDFQTFGDLGDAIEWSQIVDDGTQMLENIANIRVPFICAVEGRAWVHSEYCLLANYIVAGESATFSDAPHFAGGIVPGDGVYTAWSYHAGPLRAQALLLEPRPVGAEEARAWGVVSEVVRDGNALARAQELAAGWLTRTELTRRYTRTHFIQPLKERLIREVGYGLTLEGESADAFLRAPGGD